MSAVLLDDRGHKPPLLPYFAPYDVHVEPIEMEVGDIGFAGNGEDGQTWVVVERKVVRNDLINCIRDRRLAGGQLAGLLDYEYPYLLVEGIFRPGDGGILEVLIGREFSTVLGHQKKPMMYRELSNFLVSVQTTWGVRVLRTSSPQESAAVLVGLWHWFQKDWDEHRSHKEIYAPGPQGNGGGKARMRVERPSLAVKIAAQLPQVDRKAWAMGLYFDNDKDRLMRAIVDKDALEIGKALGIKDKKSKIVKGIFDAK